MTTTSRTSPLRMGIDLGGTKIEGVVLAADGSVLWRAREATPKDSAEAIYQVITDLVAKAEAAVGAVSVGIGTPGSASPQSGLLRGSNTVVLNNQPVQQALEAKLKRPVRMANDANCFALSEAVDGAGRGAAVVFGVILGTGVGGGVVLNGLVLGGMHGIAGEWGHNPLPWPADDERPGQGARACYCGQVGCIETWLSGPALQAHFLDSSLPSVEIALRAEQGDAAANDYLTRVEDRLARALATVINLIDPDVIVLGGGVSNIARLYQNVPPLLPRYVFSDYVSTRLLPNVHGDSSGVRGAAWLW